MNEGDDYSVDVREHHNVLERRRRDNIKEAFFRLRDALPNIQGEKASRAQILKKAIEYLDSSQSAVSDCKSDIENLRQKNEGLEQKLTLLEKLMDEGMPVPDEFYNCDSDCNESADIPDTSKHAKTSKCVKTSKRGSRKL